MEFEQFAQNGKRNSEWIVGVKVRIKTTLGEELEGEIFSYDTTTNCAVLVRIHESIMFRIWLNIQKTMYTRRSKRVTEY
jgi:small nuclear ribonucleoprotein (snRNP)-like protein